ncbi:MAG: replication-associated recombination protein A [Bacteroidetes bacterium]|nr:replication-associated recombination protein A [Bacteroidota bacterium]MBK8329055.1 replication-associated recombination protein A [Bacteroidota bacterium]
MSLPLAERLRPVTLSQLIGQQHLTAQGSMLQKALEINKVPSMILWGPPGVGKTTIANIIAHSLDRPFYTLSAISSGVKDVRAVIEKASTEQEVILFIDEIHRFNKGQQDALLYAVEKGIITLIGATTENPSFEVNSALLSRCQVYILKSLTTDDLSQLLHHALQVDVVLQTMNITIEEEQALIQLSGGDARKLLNLLELVVNNLSNENEITITNERVMLIAQNNIALYDKNGEQHYDIISAFIKSMRGSDPNAAVYWLARMIAGGEDVKFIARRMIIFASEDIGNANPNALLLANATFESVNKIGYPEARIILSQCAIYLATSVKSNASYMAIETALAWVKSHGDLPVPLHIRNAPTSLMKNLQYGKGYQYDHHESLNFAGQELLPEAISGTTLYQPGNNSKEAEIRNFLKLRWKEKYNY